MSSAVWLWGEYHCLSCVSTRHCTMIFKKVSFLGLRQLLHKHSLTTILMSIWGRPFHSSGSLIHLTPDLCSVDSSFLAVQLTLGFTFTIQGFGLRSPPRGGQPGHSLKAVRWVSGRAHLVSPVSRVAVLCCLVYSVWKTGYVMSFIFFILRVVFGVWVRFQRRWVTLIKSGKEAFSLCPSLKSTCLSLPTKGSQMPGLFNEGPITPIWNFRSLWVQPAEKL